MKKYVEIMRKYRTWKIGFGTQKIPSLPFLYRLWSFEIFRAFPLHSLRDLKKISEPSLLVYMLWNLEKFRKSQEAARLERHET